ncbi:response regulator [Desulfoferrobacter suflitae]|uniref:response regulator n=1 Tax=Desulfoferrobacter suflitae TaxID=2865782 RepID=UPI0021640DDD|nr:response regulator [Desulfoferrobacter suflitae]MCK8602833.1 response regulator [Desulfoferrobacter suflitae]
MPRILAVDDKMDNLVVLAALLKNLMPECFVSTAQSGVEGIEKARSERPDVILLDVKMPVMDGYETCRQLKADVATSHIPVVMITAIRTDAESRTKGLDLGADAFLSKPIDSAELVSQVRVALRIKKAEDALRRERDLLERIVQERTAALRESEQRFRQIYEHVAFGIARVSLDFRIENANQAYCGMLGYTEEQLIGKYLKDITAPQSLEENLELQSQLARGTINHYRMEKQFIHRDGHVVHGLLDATLIRSPQGRPAHCISCIVDITERKRAEESLRRSEEALNRAQKLESIGRLAGGVAHDHNNMLGVILGYTEMALEKVPADDPLHADLMQILHATRRSTDLTRQLLAFARRQTIVPRVLDLNETVESMLKMLRRLIGEDIDLAWLPASDLGLVNMDPAQIDQILANLCVNARDAIAGVGKVTIVTNNVTIGEENDDRNDGAAPKEYVLLAVSDSGCGMDKGKLEHIFEPFFTTKEVGVGTGLGLATVYGIVQQNNGLIEVSSNPGTGTTFKIFLPRMVGEAAGPSAQVVEEIPQGSGEMVLLVEDEAVMLKMGQAMLERLGYRVLIANTPDDALRVAAEHGDAIDLLITDVVMPKLNGRELADRLQSLHPNLRTLFMSGYTANVIAHRGVLEEGVHFIQKPFSNRDLAQKVRAALRT